MNTPTAQIHRRQPGLRAARALRLRLEPAPTGPRPHALRPVLAGHDFLVPNPRPDLTTDLNTLRMIEAE